MEKITNSGNKKNNNIINTRTQNIPILYSPRSYTHSLTAMPTIAYCVQLGTKNYFRIYVESIVTVSTNGQQYNASLIFSRLTLLHSTCSILNIMFTALYSMYLCLLVCKIQCLCACICVCVLFLMAKKEHFFVWIII